MTRRLPFGRAPVDEEVNSELAFHLEMATRELMERGMTRSQAKAEAERRFGNLESVNAECRRFGSERDKRAHRAEYRQEMGQDIAFGVRQLARARAFSAVAIITLALGIGATAAVFSALDAVVLRPLPFDHPERVVELKTSRRGSSDGPTVPEYLTMRESGIFERVAAAVLGGGTTVKIDDRPEILSAASVAADYFAVFGTRPFLGRAFTGEEVLPGAARVMIISHRLWQRRFNADQNIIGRRVSLDGDSHTIIGVMPASFDYTRGSEDIWMPLIFTPQQLANAKGARFVRVFARLRPGMSLTQATNAATVAERVWADRNPLGTFKTSEFGVSLTLFVDQLVGNYRRLFLTLLGAVAFVLLIACGNVANLLLARGTVRGRELAIRAALGAARARLVRQLFTESLVLAIAGAIVGLGVAYGLQRLIIAVSPEDIPRLENAGLDWRVLAFTLLLGVVSCLLFGLLPAIRTARGDLQTTLREGGRGSGGGRDRLRGVLVAAEVALALTLLVGSGLLIRSAILMQRVDPGFDPRGVLTARILLPESRYSTPESVTQFYARLREEASHLPGVQVAALGSIVPMSNSSMLSPVTALDQAATKEESPHAHIRLVSTGYFAAMGMHLLVGRDIEPRDDAGSPAVVIVNETLAKRMWPGISPRDAIGRHLDVIPGKAPLPRTVIGVVKDIHDALDAPPRPEFYMPFEQTPGGLWAFMHRSFVVVLRATNPNVDAATLDRPLLGAIGHLDASLPIAESRTMASYLRGSLETARMNTALLSTLGAIALVLAMVGIYGVVSYFVNQRTHEIGIRMALGASPQRIWQLVVRRGLAPIIAGLLAGLVLSLATTRVLQGRLFGVTPHDPTTLAAVAGLLVLVGLLATYVPARRAMRVPPVVALNEA